MKEQPILHTNATFYTYFNLIRLFLSFIIERYETLGGFPIEIQAQISNAIAYSLAILYYKNSKAI